MRPGQQLENYINAWCFQAERFGIHAHKNNPTRTIHGDTLNGEPFDYEFFLPDSIHVFDAKECSRQTLKWGLSIFSHPDSRYFKQLEALRMCARNKAVNAYFLVWFKASSIAAHIVMFPIDRLSLALKKGYRYLTPSDGEIWTIPQIIQEYIKQQDK